MLDLTVTAAQLARVTKEWSAIAGETLEIDATKSDEPIWAFGSELACLRLEHKMKSGHAGFSENLNTWFYRNK